MAGDDSAERRSRSGSTVMPGTCCSNASALRAKRWMASTTLQPISGIAVLSWKAEVVAPIVTAASNPTTWQQAWMTASGITGLTLPGMMLDPGWTAGNVISARPALGPDPIQRRSLQTFITEIAMTRKTPEISTKASLLDCASMADAGAVSAMPVRSTMAAIVCAANSGGALSPVPTAVPPRGTSRSRGTTDSTRLMPCRIWPAKPPNSCPSVTGAASIRCVRPGLTTSAHCRLQMRSASSSP